MTVVVEGVRLSPKAAMNNLTLLEILQFHDLVMSKVQLCGFPAEEKARTKLAPQHHAATDWK